MSWNTSELTSDTMLIQDGLCVVGSIVREDDNWLVEILWSGGDIQFQSTSIVAALAFVEGVEKTFAAIKAAQS